MARPLMPKATAVWLIDNTGLTFDQISEFCGLHMLEVQAIADGEVAIGMQGLDPVKGGELDAAEIERCEADPAARLSMTKSAQDHAKQQRKKARYTPVAKRQDRPDAIAWLLKNYPELSDGQIGKLVGTTKPTINAVRDRTHWNTPNIKPQNPVGLGLCSGANLEKAIAVARARAGTVAAAAPTQPEAAPEQRPTATVPTGDVDLENVFGPSSVPDGNSESDQKDG
ncbi:MAG: DUF1013 domain-containing protein [Rhodospirillales bacterium]